MGPSKLMESSKLLGRPKTPPGLHTDLVRTVSMIFTSLEGEKLLSTAHAMKNVEHATKEIRKTAR